jgi:hypothetical protein
MDADTIYRELALTPPALRALLAGITPEEARVRPRPDSWSILEVVCHLYDEEREDFRARLDIVLNRSGEKWPPIDPQGWVTSRQYNERDLSSTVSAFTEERKKSVTWLSGLAERNWDAEYVAPFGPVKAGDLLASWAAHDLLHIRQIVELKRARVLNTAVPYAVTYAGEW